MARRMVVLRSGWATKVVATVPGNIGGSRLSTSLTRRGTWFSMDKMFHGLVEAFEDIWAGRQDWLDACKFK